MSEEAWAAESTMLAKGRGHDPTHHQIAPGGFIGFERQCDGCGCECHIRLDMRPSSPWRVNSSGTGDR